MKIVDKCAKALYDRIKAAGHNILPMNADAWVKKAKDGLDMRNATYETLLNRANKIADDAIQNSLVRKRNTALLLRAEQNGANWVLNNFKGKLVTEGIYGLIGGTQRRVTGGRMSADLMQRHYVNKYVNGLAAKLQRSGLNKIYNSGDIDDAIAIELYLLKIGRAHV